jgi:hypothetical protein
MACVIYEYESFLLFLFVHRCFLHIHRKRHHGHMQLLPVWVRQHRDRIFFKAEPLDTCYDCRLVIVSLNKIRVFLFALNLPELVVFSRCDD